MQESDVNLNQLPSVDSLRCFVEAAQTLNFRAASRAVALTPAALGQRIRQLEDLIGQPLFVRTTRKVELTEGGMALLPYAQKVVAEAAACVRAGRRELGPTPVDLRLGTRHELGMSWVLPALPELKKRHPELTVHFYVGSGIDLLLRLRLREIDCAIGSMRSNEPMVEAIPLHPEEYVFVGKPSLLKKNPLLSPEHARNHHLVDTDGTVPLYRYWSEAQKDAAEFQFSKLRMMGTIEAVQSLVMAGEGVAVLPLYLVRAALRRKQLAPIFPERRIQSDHFRLFFRTGDPRTPLFQSVAQFFQAIPLR